MVVAHVQELSEALVAGYPGRSGLGMLKEQVRYLGRTLPDPAPYLRSALRSQTVEELLSATTSAFLGLGAADLDLQAAAGTRERSGSAKVAAAEKPVSISLSCGETSAFGLVSSV
jgi:hypothetical protein